jgi:uncharacterized protein
MQEEVKIVTCPTCGGKSVYATTNLVRPFCSSRCKGIDFSAWASERFRMPADASSAESQLGDERLQ